MKICSSLYLIVYNVRNSRPDLKQIPNMNTDHWFLPHSLLSLLSYKTQDHRPRGGPAHSELAPPTSIINQKTQAGHYYEDIFSVKIPDISGLVLG